MSVRVERVIESNADDYLDRVARELPMFEDVVITVFRGTATCNNPCRVDSSIRQGSTRGFICTVMTSNGDEVTGDTSHYERALCGMNLR